MMPIFELPKSTRRQTAMAILHILMLTGALVVAWQKYGPPAEKAFWAIFSYFVEIAFVGFIEVAMNFRRRVRKEIDPFPTRFHLKK